MFFFVVFLHGGPLLLNEENILVGCETDRYSRQVEREKKMDGCCFVSQKEKGSYCGGPL